MDASGCPVHRDDRKSAALAAVNVEADPGARMVEGFAAGRDILRNPGMLQAGIGAEQVKVSNPDHMSVFFLDGERHKKRRTAIARFFTPKAIAGRYRATITARSRELLTELIPTLLKELGGTTHPDGALMRFDQFLARLPAGVQLFSLFRANPRLLTLVADLMGTAPRLAGHLSRNVSLFDAMLAPDFFEPIPPVEAFAGELTDFDLPLEIRRGSEFERAVWREIAAIPYGETASYGAIARAVGEPGGAQAVGTACNRNPLPVVIACHRVIGSDGKLVGFGGGLDLKRWLLQLEAKVHLERTWAP